MKTSSTSIKEILYNMMEYILYHYEQNHNHWKTTLFKVKMVYLKVKMVYMKVKMTSDSTINNINESSTHKLLQKLVLHKYMAQKLKNMEFCNVRKSPFWICQFSLLVTGWRTSTSLIFHVWGPLDSNQVRNSLNTILRGLIVILHDNTSFFNYS